MTIPHHWPQGLRESGKPAYLALADLIAEDIQTRRLPSGSRLPSLRTLADALALDYTTVARGYAEAQRRGLISAKAGLGTFVRTGQVMPNPRPLSAAEMTMNLPPEPQDKILLQRLAAGFTQLQMTGDPYTLLRYQEFGGRAEDKAAGRRWLISRLPGLSVEQILVCPGVQSALLGLITMLTRPGELICTEAVTYPGIKALAMQLGVRLLGLPTDDAGIDPQAFAHACRQHKPKALYCNPTLLNPTTATMPLARRQAIAAIALEHGIPIIEDDAYGYLPVQTPPPLACLAPHLTYYVTGLAKCMGAGLRIAHVAAPDVHEAKRLTVVLRATAIMASPITTALATRWINDGTAQAMLHAVRGESNARQQIAARILAGYDYANQPEAFHLWLKLPRAWQPQEFSLHLRKYGIGVVGSDAFTVAGPAPQAVRLCLGGPLSRDELRQALVLIADTLAQPAPMAAGFL